MPHLPLFPLKLVAYPGESVNLHIFEPRYRQLIGECLADDTTFGIPVFIDDKMPGFGTEMVIDQLVKRYDDGKLDIKVVGLRVFRLLSFQNPAPGRLYPQGTVEHFPGPEPHLPVSPELHNAVARLYQLLNETMPAYLPSAQPYSYQIGHHVGLPIEGEYELLTIQKEEDRQAFLLDHLTRALPMLEDLERTRSRIRMNGHFREFDELKF